MQGRFLPARVKNMTLIVQLVIRGIDFLEMKMEALRCSVHSTKSHFKESNFPVFCDLSTLDFSSNRQSDGDFFSLMN